MNMKKEWALENASHKYWSFRWILSRVGVLVLLSASVLIVKLLRPEYGTIDIVVILSAGMILGAFYVQSQDKIGAHFKRKVEEIETKHPDS
jgi:Na+-translocating ferredoxin:NAD+ oxidoreductase RnfD subunit